jgi:Cu/Ag efflux protein CusF
LTPAKFPEEETEMKRYTLQSLAVVLLSMLIGAPAIAAADKAMSTEVAKITATVTDIDYAARRVTLQHETGQLETIEVASEVKRLKEVKKGDRVQVQVYRAVVAEMHRHGETGTQRTEEVQRAKADEPPGVAGRRDVKSTVTINDVDTANNLVSVTGEHGIIAVLSVKSPQMRAFVKGLKRGDKVDVTYTEAVAISVEPASK